MRKKRSDRLSRDKKRKKPYSLKIEILKLIVLFLILISSSIAVYYFFFYTPRCFDESCFSLALISCERTEYLKDSPEATWLYVIKGKSVKEKEECEVYIKFIQAKKGKTDIMSIEGKEMICLLPLGALMQPEQNLEFCTGKLKEGLQDLIIKRMHAYILENLETINEEIENVTKAV